MSIKARLPRGMRDQLPDAYQRRERVLQSIRRTYRRYGFQPIETPAMELLDTLLGKYGDEGDRLIFKVLNSGDFLQGSQEIAKEQPEAAQLAREISEKGLRYDLTVPLARFVAMYRHELTFPFKRYQVQSVWRADRPQKGRFREFYQCDADAIGSYGLVYDAECLLILHEALRPFEVAPVLWVNNRKVLAGMAEVAGVSEHLNAITNTLDKLDKIGTERVLAELQALPIGEEAFAGLRRFTEMATAETIDWDVWNEALGASATGREGLAELRSVLTTVASADTQAYASLRPHLLLARGLDYYTGTIFEAQLPGSGVGSIGSGGRYDHLTEVFGLPNMPGIGVSFGLDRLVEALSSLGKLEAAVSPAAQVLVAHTGDQTLPAAMGLAARLRAQDLAVEVYPEAQKLKKQLAYADKKQIPFVLIPGAEEQARGEVQLKNLATGEQRAVKTEEAVAFFVGAKA